MKFSPDHKPEPRKKAKKKRIPFRSERRMAQEEEYKTLRDQYLIDRSEEHTSELQSQAYLVCRLLLEKKKNKIIKKQK